MVFSPMPLVLLQSTSTSTTQINGDLESEQIKIKGEEDARADEGLGLFRGQSVGVMLDF